MTLLEEACELLKTARLEAGIACSCSPRRVNGEAACIHTQQIDDINAWIARAAEAGDQGADVEARTVELSNDEREALRWARLCVLDDRQRTDRTRADERAWGEKWDGAIAVLDKLIASHLEGRPK